MNDAFTMILVVQWWFFVPFGKRGRVLNAIPVNHPQCPFIQMTDTDVTFLSCYNTVGHTRMHVMTLTSPSDPAALQTLGRVEYATTYAAASPDSRTATPLILTLFSQRLLDASKKLTLSVSTCLPTITRILPEHTWHDPASYPRT